MNQYNASFREKKKKEEDLCDKKKVKEDQIILKRVLLFWGNFIVNVKKKNLKK